MYDPSTVYNLPDILRGNTYPGRGIALGKTPDGVPVAVYFIMGRSVNSRNRMFIADEDDLFIRINDPAKLDDPSLILYRPVRRLKDNLIVTNGDQTDTIHDALAQGGTFQAALDTRQHEPDAPHFTPRISGLLPLDDGRVAVDAAHHDASGEHCDRLTCHMTCSPARGPVCAHLPARWQPVPSFAGELPDQHPSDIQALLMKFGAASTPTTAWHLLRRTDDTYIFNRHAKEKTHEELTQIWLAQANPRIFLRRAAPTAGEGSTARRVHQLHGRAQPSSW